MVREEPVIVVPLHVSVRGVRGIHSCWIVDTDALKYFPDREGMLAHTRSRTPAGRLTTPEDVAQVVGFLVSEGSRMMHGQVVVVDGGYSILA